MIRELLTGNKDLLSNYNYARLTVGGDIPEEKIPSPIPFLKTEKQYSLWDIERIFLYIEKSGLQGILLVIKNTNIGYGRANALRNALKRLMNGNKKVYVQLESPGNIEYFIASPADHISISPMSTLNFTGISSEVFFFRDLLDKIDIVPEIIGVGDYKSAAEKFNRSSMSDYNREMLNSILDDQFGRILSGIAEARKLEEDKLREYLEYAPYSPEKAVKYGLIDGINHENDLMRLMEDSERTKLRIVEMDRIEKLISYSIKLRNLVSRFRTENNNVGLVTVDGIITQGKSRSGTGGVKTAGSDTIIKTLETVRKDISVRAVVIRMMSPGGSAVASDLIRNSIERLSQIKPVYISMSDVAASGGYMSSLSASRIFSDAFTLTGSIGVVAGKMNIRGLLNKLGINSEILKRGKMSAIYSVTEGFSDDEKENFMELIKKMYSDFVTMVSRARKLSYDNTEQIARGRVWTGSQAKELSLVDSEGGLVDAIQSICSELGIEEDTYRVVKVFNHENRMSVKNLGSIFGSFSSDCSSVANPGECIFAVTPFWIRIR